jgi:hypothetical protein
MNRHCHRSRRVARVDEDVMAADDSADYKSGLGQGADDLPLTTGSRPPPITKRPLLLAELQGRCRRGH